MTTASNDALNDAESSPMSQDLTSANSTVKPPSPAQPSLSNTPSSGHSANPAQAAHGHGRHDLTHKIFAASVPGTEIKKQISYIAPGQTAKALMLIYLTFSVPIVLLAIVVGFFRYRGQIQIGSMFSTIFSALIVNAVVGFILLWIACQAYNWVASRFGGIEIILSDAPEDV